MSEISFFDHDVTNRVFSYFRLGSERNYATILRILLVFSITWIPLFLLSLVQGVAVGRVPKEDFLYDFAAYGQFWIGIPLFIFAESYLGRMLDEAGGYFVQSGLVAEHDSKRFKEAAATIKRLRTSALPELSIVALSLGITGLWISQETSDGISTWHALIGADGIERVTLAGIWVGFIAVPVYQFFLLRWVWKIYLWVRFLWRMSKMDLQLNVLHPDKAGGLGFLGTVQGAFGILVFAEGSVIAATIGYKLMISENPAAAIGVWGPIVGFVVLAPLLFLLPLIFFTKSLFSTKERGVYRIGTLASMYIRAFDKKWMSTKAPDQSSFMGNPDVQSLAAFTITFENAHSMKIVPFDLKSVLQLLVAAAGPMLPLASRFLPDNVLKILSGIFGGH
ncbi:MAG: hypothetical protein WBD36_04470 [Bacteroidota bacterium]